MPKRIKLFNKNQQHEATVLFFYEESIDQYVGIIISADLNKYLTKGYQTDSINEAVADLAKQLDVSYFDFYEVSNSSK